MLAADTSSVCWQPFPSRIISRVRMRVRCRHVTCKCGGCGRCWCRPCVWVRRSTWVGNMHGRGCSSCVASVRTPCVPTTRRRPSGHRVRIQSRVRARVRSARVHRVKRIRAACMPMRSVWACRCCICVPERRRGRAAAREATPMVHGFRFSHHQAVPPSESSSLAPSTRAPTVGAAAAARRLL